MGVALPHLFFLENNKVNLGGNCVEKYLYLLVS